MALVDYFLKLDGIKGESEDHKHKGEIDVLSWSFGASQQGTSSYGSGAGAGKVAMQDFHFVKKVDLSSPELFLRCSNGLPIGKVELFARKAGGDQQEYMKWTMTDVLVSSYQIGGSQGDVVPNDQVSLNFAKIEIEYKAQDAKGKLGAGAKAGWDLKKNQKV